MRPIPVSTLLAATLLAAPLSGQITGGLRPAAAQRAGQVTVQTAHLQSLQGRLDGFAAQLPAEERALWDHLLLRAAHAPSPGRREVRVTPVLEIGPGGGCDDPAMEVANRVAIVVQGGRTAGASGIVVQGGRTPRPNPAGAAAIGPKPEDPSTPPRSLSGRIASFSQGLAVEERAALNWLLTRAATEARPGAPGTLPPGPCTPEGGCRPPVGGSPLSVSLRQALGIDALAIGPKPEDPTTPPRATPSRWVLRF